MNLDPKKINRIVDEAGADAPGWLLVSPLVISKVYRDEANVRDDAERLVQYGGDVIVARIVAVYRKPKPE